MRIRNAGLNVDLGDLSDRLRYGNRKINIVDQRDIIDPRLSDW